MFFNPTRGQVEARARTSWVDLVIDETPVAISDPAAAASLLAEHARQDLDRLLPAADTPAGRFLARVRWLAAALPDLELPALDRAALESLLPDLCHGQRSLDELRSADWLSLLHAQVGYDRLAEIDRLAPEEIELPSGNRHKIAYDAGAAPILAARIQELFGWPETPRIAAGRVPLLLHLQGPNHRTQQVTADLASFWKNTYPEVKKELRRRYPKHAWPDDPLTAQASRSGLTRNREQ
jgi:ATP-dependent helicase HrpB